MSSLGDFIPSENIKNIISMQIQPGAVFLLYDKNAGKHKFIVILGVDAARVCVGTLYINSEVNTNVIRTLEQRHLQFRIKARDYDFLDHDSWINASNSGLWLH
jgi:hypothetical protein